MSERGSDQLPVYNVSVEKPGFFLNDYLKRLKALKNLTKIIDSGRWNHTSVLVFEEWFQSIDLLSFHKEREILLKFWYKTIN